MDKAAMVSLEVHRGKEMVEALESANLKIGVALWIFLSEYEDWRMILSARQFDSLDPRAAYRLLHTLLDREEFPPERTPPILILKMTDPFIKALRSRFAKNKNVEGIRVGSQSVGDRFVEDSYLYRVS